MRSRRDPARRAAVQPARVSARGHRRGGGAAVPRQPAGAFRMGGGREARVRLLHLRRRRRRPPAVLPDGHRTDHARDAGRRQRGDQPAGQPRRQPAPARRNQLAPLSLRRARGWLVRGVHRQGAAAPAGLSGVINATSTGPSADAYIAAKVHPDKVPIALYAGNINNGYEAQRLSFTGPGQLTTPISANPYDLYLELMGLALPGGAMTPANRRTAELLLQSRKSVHDLVRDDLTTLMRHPRLGTSDHQRLQQHFDAIRDAEKTMTDLGGQIVDQCTSVGLDVTTLEALKGYRYDRKRTDEIATLHMSLVAMAFACNYRRAASLQWGDPNDNTLYDVPSNDRGWKFNFISHRVQSDAAIGDDPLAAKAHAEIDVRRMRALSAGLDHFKARGLADQCVVTWTVSYSDGPSHSPRERPPRHLGQRGWFLEAGPVSGCRRHDATTACSTRCSPRHCRTSTSWCRTSATGTAACSISFAPDRRRRPRGGFERRMADAFPHDHRRRHPRCRGHGQRTPGGRPGAGLGPRRLRRRAAHAPAHRARRRRPDERAADLEPAAHARAPGRGRQPQRAGLPALLRPRRRARRRAGRARAQPPA